MDMKSDSSSSSLNQLLKAELKRVFGYSGFRSELQEKAVKCVLDGKRDCFISMPTGAGKSLCFQLPAICREPGQLTIVISPLIALITNQLEHMNRLKVRTETINSTQPKTTTDKIKNELFNKECKIKMLYLTPEMICGRSFEFILEYLHKTRKLRCIAIDEAHCVSQWGHDFRPDYLKLGNIKRRFPDLQFVALTATASPKVVEDIIQSLSLREPVAKFTSSPFRENLYYDVRLKNGSTDSLTDLKQFAEDALNMTTVPPSSEDFKKALEMFKPPPSKRKKGLPANQTLIKNYLTAKEVAPKLDDISVGIIYCRTRQACEEIAYDLTKKGLLTRAYHAGLGNNERKDIQEKWQKGLIRVIAATISFGMGVDKSNVRFVAHWNLPQSLIGYYQESGRAGRDSKPSKCRIYYSHEDRDTIRFLLSQDVGRTNDKGKQDTCREAVEKFEKMVHYCENFLLCRHILLMREFDNYPKDFKGCIKHCDVCSQPKVVKAMVGILNQLKQRGRRAPAVATSGETMEFGLTRYEDDGNKSDNHSSREKEEKTFMKNVVMNEFEKRRRSRGSVGSTNSTPPVANIRNTINTMSDKSKILEPDNRRLKDIDITTRCMFYGKLKNDLTQHYDNFVKYTPASMMPGTLNENEIERIAAEYELKLYKEKKNQFTYKTGFVSISSQLKIKNQIQLHQVFLDWLAINKPSDVEICK